MRHFLNHDLWTGTVVAQKTIWLPMKNELASPASPKTLGFVCPARIIPAIIAECLFESTNPFNLFFISERGTPFQFAGLKRRWRRADGRHFTWPWRGWSHTGREKILDFHHEPDDLDSDWKCLWTNWMSVLQISARYAFMVWAGRPGNELKR
jgi:hypothetical protein